MKNLLIIFTFIFASFSANAQTSQSVEIKNFIKSYVNQVQKIDNGEHQNKLLAFYSPSYKGSTTFINLSGNTRIKNRTYKDLSNAFGRLKVSDDKTLKLQVESINVDFEKPNYAVVSYTVDYDVKNQGKLVQDGKIITSNVIRKTKDGEWKFVTGSSVETINEKFSGNCKAELFGNQQKNSDIIAKVGFPEGSKYTTDLINFEIKNQKDHVMIMANEKYFIWDDGKVATYDINKDKFQNDLGKAKTKDEAVKIILSKDLYKDQCINFSYR
ncbi:hypothetical protein [Aureibacter tunicatorum]|uniref:Ketosteroid isomerase-like protein n=1 Tax=Aureibacter tunicatorum TaxID=866807 RepID=A0AAE4BUC3_9BACT|nr:hypothetical protein [Aureibacter tunicatorum]MDR6241646.1 ketosteroid isomerase-like protein [Aureibacter tunicatorum]BDD07367.1 hypothetical protein AUTU_48500 [Aureibacter tunicatorum]